MYKAVPDLKAGDVVLMHGGRFQITGDAHESMGHRPCSMRTMGGPSDAARAPSTCLSGTAPGYFAPGTSWTFQGNQHARFAVES